MGGRAAGRSYAASQFALSKLVAPEYFRCAIMRYVLTDIRNSIYQEIRDRIDEQGIEDAITIIENRLNFAYGQNRINGIGFRKSSGDQKSKLKSLANYNCVIIEEADEVNEEDFQQLDDSLRTLKSDIKIILLCNPPPKNHWIVRRWFNLIDSPVDGFFIPELRSDQTDTTFIYTNYKNNAQNLNKSTLENFKRYKQTRPDHYYNMIEGYISEGNRGRIFKNWEPISLAEFQALEYPSFYGLDFGFENDETALTEIKMHNNKVYVRELLYQTGVRNRELVKTFEDFGVSKNHFIYADHNEAKTVDELQNEHGYNVVKATKGQGSIMAGINMLLDKEVYYTEDSTNIAQETQDYVWRIDRSTKEPTNEPEDKHNHLMDSIRMGVFSESQSVPLAFG